MSAFVSVYVFAPVPVSATHCVSGGRVTTTSVHEERLYIPCMFVFAKSCICIFVYCARGFRRCKYKCKRRELHVCERVCINPHLNVHMQGKIGSHGSGGVAMTGMPAHEHLKVDPAACSSPMAAAMHTPWFLFPFLCRLKLTSNLLFRCS